MKFLYSILLTISLLTASTTLAWDSTGHRISAAVAVNFLSAETRRELVSILEHHPRFDQDFIASIPGFVNRDNERQLQEWLLGQAAFWPDIARGLTSAEADKYNRTNWHYIDGAWLRDLAQLQGNVYVGVDGFRDIQGTRANRIGRERDVDNIITALDYNSRVLADESNSLGERAVALCWLLHLMADIHQPLHTGSLYSNKLFAQGDRGGNRIPTDDGNLHARWDRALSDKGIRENLAEILDMLADELPESLMGIQSDWTIWMHESRMLMHESVYPQATRAAIIDADVSGDRLGSSRLDADYVRRMIDISKMRLGLAGLRMAIWFENELP